MAFEHDDRKPYEFTWFLVASGDAGFLPPPVCSLQMVHVKKVCIYTKLPKYTSFHIIFFFHISFLLSSWPRRLSWFAFNVAIVCACAMAPVLRRELHFL